MTIDISKDILNGFWVLFKNVNPMTKLYEIGIRLIFKKNIAHLTHRPTLRTLIIAFAKRLKSLFVQAKSTQTLCARTIHVLNENNSAIVMPTVRGECTTNCKCSQLFHTCLQRIIGSCRDGEFHVG